MIKIICDRCGAEMKEDEEAGYVAIGVNNNPLSDEAKYDAGWIENHFCADCINKIRDFMKSASVIDHAPEPTPKVKTKPTTKPPDILSVTPGGEIEQLEFKPKGRRKIDIGKIMALKNAGWNYQEIGEEMGIDATAVGQAIWRYNKKKGTNHENT